MAEKARPSCFFICPIGDEHADFGKQDRPIWEDSIQVWEKVIEPACKQLEIEVVRADQIAKGGEIPEQICRRVRDADIVVADLTGGNANVMYELGLRHTLTKPTIQIGERGRLPFDVAAIRTIMFMRTEGGLIEARKRLGEALETALNEGTDAVTATRVWNELRGSSLDHPAKNEEQDVVGQTEEQDEEPGFLEKLAGAEDAIGEVSDSLGDITQVVERISGTMSAATEETRRAENTGGGAGARLAIAERTATRLDETGTDLEVGIARYEELIARIAPGMDYILERLEQGLEEEWPTEFVKTLLGYGEILEGNQESMEGFVGSLRGVGGATRSLRRATTRLAAAIRRMIDANEVQLGWVRRLRALTAGNGAGGPTGL